MIKEMLTTIEEKMKDFDLDGAASDIKQLSDTYALHEIGSSLIHTEHITDFLIEMYAGDKESGWQSMYCCIHDIQSLSTEWYYIDNYNTLNDLSLASLERILGRLKEALSHKIQIESLEMEE